MQFVENSLEHSTLPDLDGLNRRDLTESLIAQCQVVAGQPEAQRQECFRAILTGLQDEIDDEPNRAAEIAIRLIQIFTWATNTRLLAHAFLWLMGRNPRSERDVADEFGLGRAAVSKVKTELQEILKLECRAGRSAEARERFRQLCLKRHRKKPRSKPRPQEAILPFCVILQNKSDANTQRPLNAESARSNMLAMPSCTRSGAVSI